MLSVAKPLWLDEIASINLLDANSGYELLSNIYNGADTNPPIYFLLIYFIKSTFGQNETAFKLFSTFFFMGGCIFIYMLVKKLFFDKIEASFVILLISVTGFFSQFLMTEIRPYSLMFFLACFIIYFYYNVTVKKKNLANYLLIFLSFLTLIYTHYFGLIYLFTFIFFEFLHQTYLSEKKDWKSLYIFLFVLILFTPWIPAVINQYNSFNGIAWQSKPSFLEILIFPLNIFKYLVLFSIPLFCLILWRKEKLKRTLVNNKFILFLAILLIATQIIVGIFSLIGWLVYADRYLTISIIGYLLLFTFLINAIKNNRMIIWASVILFCLFGIHRVLNYQTIVEHQNKVLYNRLNVVRTGLPVLCESPHVFYPINYYLQKLNINGNVFLILDYKSSTAQGNIKNSIFDYFGNKNLKSFYDFPNVLEWESFNKFNYYKFYLINEKDRMTYEFLIEKNNLFNKKNIGKDLIEIKRH